MRLRRRWWAVAVALGLLALLMLPGIGLAETTIKSDMVAERRNADVPPDLVVQGDVRVTRADGTIRGKVDGNVWIERGDLNISGQVTGDVHVVRGTITVTGSGRIDGTLYLERSNLTRLEGAQIAKVQSDNNSNGDVVLGPEGLRAGDVQIGPDGIHGPGINIGPNGVHLPGIDIDSNGVRTPGMIIGPGGIRTGNLGSLAWFFGIFNPVFKFFKWAALFALALLVVAIWPQPVQNLSLLIDEDPGRTFLAGLLATGLFVVALIALAITLIGIPLAVLLGFVAMVAWFFGYVVLSVYLGQKIGEVLPSLRGNGHSPFLPLLVGSLALALAGLVPLVGWLVGFAAWFFAVGVVYQSRFGLGWPHWKRHASPTP